VKVGSCLSYTIDLSLKCLIKQTVSYFDDNIEKCS